MCQEKCENPKGPSNDQDNGLVPEPNRGTQMYLFGCFLSVLASCLRACSMAGAQVS